MQETGTQLVLGEKKWPAPISWSSDNGNHLFVDSVDEGSGGSSSNGTYLTQVAANSAGV